MFRARDSAGVRAIQDALRCCGLRSPVDMAWPFPGAGRSGRECERAFEGGAVQGCLGAWRGQERVVGGMLVGVAVGVFAWMVSFLLAFLTLFLLVALWRRETSRR